MRSIKPNDRAASGPPSPAAVLCHARFPMSFPLPKPLSLNVFYQSRQIRLGSLRKGNCRSIEVVLLCPLYAPPSPILGRQPSPSSVAEFLAADLGLGEGSIDTLERAKMFADQEPEVVSPTTDELSHDSFVPPASLLSPTIEAEGFRYLDLPLELRLKIYGYLLPPRNHTIVTQIPFNGYFYNTSTIPADSATSFYPFGRTAPTPQKQGYTTYKVLTTNHRTDFPVLSIHPEIFRVSKKILVEAEPVLYGSNLAAWDFGIHLDAVLAFWGDRSEVARKCVRNMRIARQIPHHATLEYSQAMDPLWQRTCDFIQKEMLSLRKLDLTMWSSIGAAAPFSSTSNGTTPEAIGQQQIDAECKLQDWEWTSGLLSMPALREAKVTWWGFQSEKGVEEAVGSEGWSGFGSWIAGRMVGDRLVRDRMVRDGVVVEGIVVLKGPGA